MRFGTISGSLQQTIGGSSYLVAGSNVTIVSGSNGQVTISAASSGGPVNVLDLDFSTVAAETIASGSTRTWGGLSFTINHTNATVVTDASGLLVTQTGAGSVYLKVATSQCGLTDILTGNWRTWLRISSFDICVAGEDLYAGLVGTLTGDIAEATPAAAWVNLVSSPSDIPVNKFLNCYPSQTGTVVTTSDTSVVASDVVILECVGGRFFMRVGTWSSGWPSLASCRIMLGGVFGTSQLLSTTTGRIPISQALCIYGRRYVTSSTRAWRATNIRIDRW